MKYLAAIHTYGKNYRLLSLNATNPEDAQREAYDRAFCEALAVPVTVPDYDGSPLARKQLLASIPMDVIRTYMARNRLAERFDAVGNRLNSVEPMTCLIKVFAISEAFHCQNGDQDTDWQDYFITQYQEIKQRESKSEIQELEKKIEADRQRLEDLKKSK